MKKILLIIASLAIFSTPYISAQIMLGETTAQNSIDVVIDDDGNIHVTHELGKNLTPSSMTLISGTQSDIKVRDESGNDAQYATSETQNNTSLSFFQPVNKITVEYDLKDVLFIKEGVWTWDFLYYEHDRTVFHLPQKVDLVFVNQNPIVLKDTKQLGCNGCDMILEYVIDEEITSYKISKNGDEFDITARTQIELENLQYNSLSQGIEFEINNENQIIVLEIPLELLSDNWKVFLNNQQISRHEFARTDDKVSISIRPDDVGKITIAGDTKKVTKESKDVMKDEMSFVIPLAIGLAISIVAIIIGLKYKAKITRR